MNDSLIPITGGKQYVSDPDAVAITYECPWCHVQNAARIRTPVVDRQVYGQIAPCRGCRRKIVLAVAIVGDEVPKAPLALIEFQKKEAT